MVKVDVFSWSSGVAGGRAVAETGHCLQPLWNGLILWQPLPVNFNYLTHYTDQNDYGYKDTPKIIK